VTIDPVGAPHVPDSSGVALPHLDVRIEDDEVVVRAATDGPWAGAYTPMLGFWEDGALTPFGQDVLRTGDIGAFDDDGRLFIRDRKKLLIIRGGANVYPAEVERVLATAPGVRGSVAMGIPDERLGERVVAAVEVDGTAFVGTEALLEHCRANLARYKVPDEIVVLDELPRNAMGKVQRALLVDRFTPRPTGI
jgi:long-chain acyl-CoA synthetase